MARLQFIVALALIAAAQITTPAAASGGGGSSAGASNRIQANFTMGDEDVVDEDEHSAADSPRAVDVPTLVAPTFEDGRLQHYLFISVRLILESGVNAWDVREDAHYIRDAMIRAAHRENIAVEGDPATLDEDVARDLLGRAAAEIIGAAAIERIEFTSVDTRLRSSR